MNTTQKLLFEQKLDARLAQGFLYTAKNSAGQWSAIAAPDVYTKMVELYVDGYNGGRVSSSAFEIVEREMVASGDLRPIAAEEDKTDSIAQKIKDFDAGKISVYDFRLACKQDRDLRDAYERSLGLNPGL